MEHPELPDLPGIPSELKPVVLAILHARADHPEHSEAIAELGMKFACDYHHLDWRLMREIMERAGLLDEHLYLTDKGREAASAGRRWLEAVRKFTGKQARKES